MCTVHMFMARATKKELLKLLASKISDDFIFQSHEWRWILVVVLVDFDNGMLAELRRTWGAQPFSLGDLTSEMRGWAKFLPEEHQSGFLELVHHLVRQRLVGRDTLVQELSSHLEIMSVGR